MKESIKLICFALFWVMWGALLCLILTKCGGLSVRDNTMTEEIKRDTIFVTDTIVEIEPVPVSIAATEIVNRKLAVAYPLKKDSLYSYCSLDSLHSVTNTDMDSVEVKIPITQAEYKSDDYHAWISGFEAKLDSIRIFKQTEYITVEKLIKPKEKHWHLGPTIGYGYTPKGFEPFIGVSLTYSLISF